jgi:alpha-glucosidase
MHWDGSPSAGFTKDGVTPWLPYGDNATRNVATQRDEPGSTLRLCRDLLALRRAELGGQIAAYEQLPAPPGVWAYRAGPLVVAANFSGEQVPLPESLGEVLLATGRVPEPAEASPVLGPWEGAVSRASLA